MFILIIVIIVLSIGFIIDKNAYDNEGYDKEGYNRKGYNKQGYNKEGYSEEGYDREGYNDRGYNREGYDKIGHNADGYYKYGYSKEGYNKCGRGRKGYNKQLLFKALETSSSKDDKINILKYVLDDYSNGIVNQELLEQIIEKFDDKELIDILKYKYKILNKDLNNNRGFLLGIVKKRGYLLEYASVGLQDDQNIVFEAVKNNGTALKYVSKRLRNNKEIVFEALNKRYYFGIENVFNCISERLKNDKDIILKVAPQCLSTLKYTNLNLRNNKEIMFEILKSVSFREGYGLDPGYDYFSDFFENLGDKLKNDFDFILDGFEIINDTSKAIPDIINNFDEGKLISKIKENYKGIKNNDRFFSIILQAKSHLLEYASVDIQDNDNIVTTAVESNGLALKYASERLRNDKDIVLKALNKKIYFGLEDIFKSISEKLREDKDIITQAIIQDISIFRYVSLRLRSDKESMLYILTSLVNNKKYNSTYYDYIGDALKKDSRFIIEASEIIKGNNKKLLYVADFQFIDSSKVYKYIVDENFNDNYFIDDIVNFTDHRGMTKEVIIKSKKYSLDMNTLPYELKKINIISKKEKNRNVSDVNNDEYNGDYDYEHNGNYSNLSDSATELGFINESDYEDWLDSKSDK